MTNSLVRGIALFSVASITLFSGITSVYAQGTTNPPSPAPVFKLVDVATAKIPELDTLELPGTGKMFSERILAGRPYASLFDMIRPDAITLAEFIIIKNLVTLDGKPFSPVNVSTAKIPELDLLELPGTGKQFSERILAGRPYATLEELVTKNSITKEEFDIIKDLITL